jgi:hypothetical protein
MSVPRQPALCEHRQNPAACLSCFHNRGRAPRQAAARPAVAGGRAIVAPPEIQKVIDRGFQNNMGVQVGAVPPPQGPQATVPGAPPPPRPQAAQDQGAPMPEPFRYEGQQWVTNPVTGVDEPPKRRSLIDSAPRHPEAP